MKPTARKTSPKVPFNVPAPVEQVLKTAGHQFDALSVKAKNVAVQTEKKVKVAARDLKKTGESLAKDPRAFVEDVMESGRDFGQMLRKNAGKVGDDVQERVQKVGAEAARRAEGVAKNVSETVGMAVERGLHSLNVPTRKELRSLSAKVDGLGRKIDALRSRRPARATRRAR
ncbi:MAG TPA: phasin family protein [Thermoanaerobaculia bacterium]|jgi:polyhydroxyalkanoate synthesis regulator phasin|nr:phasin family protein [Thermoanaerobaculia bacterium]